MSPNLQDGRTVMLAIRAAIRGACLVSAVACIVSCGADDDGEGRSVDLEIDASSLEGLDASGFPPRPPTTCKDCNGGEPPTRRDAGASDAGLTDDGSVSRDASFGTCANLFGNWLFVTESVDQSGCGIANCGTPGLAECGSSILGIATQGAQPGDVVWLTSTQGLIGNYEGPLLPDGTFEAENQDVPNATFTGVVGADCQLRGTIEFSRLACRATVVLSGTPQ